MLSGGGIAASRLFWKFDETFRFITCSLIQIYGRPVLFPCPVASTTGGLDSSLPVATTDKAAIRVTKLKLWISPLATFVI